MKFPSGSNFPSLDEMEPQIQGPADHGCSEEEEAPLFLEGVLRLHH